MPVDPGSVTIDQSTGNASGTGLAFSIYTNAMTPTSAAPLSVVDKVNAANSDAAWATKLATALVPYLSPGAQVATGTVTFATGTSNVDLVAYTVPASPSGNGRFILTDCILRSDGIGGSDTGNVVLTVGTTVGGNDIITAQTITKTTPAGIIGGLAGASLGSAMLAANFFELALNPGATINLRAASTSAVSAGKTATIDVFGLFIA